MDLILNNFIAKLRQDKFLGAVYIANILLSFHYYLLIYINSSYLAQFFSATQVSALYIIGSTASLLILLNVPKILERIGNYRMIAWLIILEAIAAFGLAFSVSLPLIAIYFLIYQISIPTISFGLDILLEAAVKDEHATGRIRTAFITVGNVSLVLCTLILTAILTDNTYYRVYLASIVFLIPLYWVIKNYFKGFIDGEVKHIKIKETIRTYLTNKDLGRVFTTHLYLQIFYAYMVVYTPIYLSKYIGFSWTEISLMFTIMLLPFIFVEVPVGWLADKLWGEKEMMTVGLAITGLFTVFMSVVTAKNFLLWTAILFMTRVGAAMLEATADSYFFKKVNKNDADTIGFFRIGGPLSFVIAPIMATISLQFLPFSAIFIVIGGLMIYGCRYSLALNDTK